MNINRYRLFLLGFPKSLRFNFRYFPFRVAIKLPVWLTHRVRLKSLKGNVSIESEEIRSGMISIGFGHVSISDVNEYSLWNVEGTVVFKGRAGFGAGTKIAVGKDAILTFGEGFLVTARSEFACFREITFGRENLVSWDVLVMDTDAHPIYDQQNRRMNKDRPIRIGDHVWIGCRSVILKGAEVANGCIVGAGSLVNGKFNRSSSVIAGNPARIVKENVSWQGSNG